MALRLMYITNNPEIASVAQASGVDRIFVDMECIGKEERQLGMNTVKCRHTYSDIENMARVTQSGTSELLVRVNPIHEATKEYCSSEEEIETAISCGAEVIMLPMFKTCHDVERFINAVNGKAKTLLLLETKDAMENIDSILSAGGFDELHIGLNDLHLALGKRFMFELLTDGTVEQLTYELRRYGINFGFGGIARIGYGDLPAEYVIAEHYRLGSQAAILSRSFCNAENIENIGIVRKLFEDGVRDIRAFENLVLGYSDKEFSENRKNVISLVENIVRGI